MRTKGNPYFRGYRVRRHDSHTMRCLWHHTCSRVRGMRECAKGGLLAPWRGDGARGGNARTGMCEYLFLGFLHAFSSGDGGSRSLVEGVSSHILHTCIQWSCNHAMVMGCVFDMGLWSGRKGRVGIRGKTVSGGLENFGVIVAWVDR